MPFPSEGIAGHILGIGIDLVDVGRVRDALRRFPERFARRILSEAERDYCLSRPDPAPHIAARFAAKEAVIKCLGGGCALNEIEVVRALSGSPSITLHGRAKARAGNAVVLISLSHLDHLATAYATLVEQTPSQQMKTAQDAITAATVRLELGGIPPAEAASEAHTIVRHVADLTPEALRMHASIPISSEVTEKILEFARRRARREPLAYILGKRGFYGLPFTVTPAVLIPRPETEFVVTAILNHLRDRATARIADIGTGSGAIAVAVAHRMPGAHVWATDVSHQALEVARKNAADFGLTARIRVAYGDLLAPLAADAPFDVIASNPPYISPAEIAGLEPEVRDWEPCVALGVNEDPLHFYRRFAVEAPPLLSEGGMLVVEVGQGQAQTVAALWRDAGLTDVRITPDYAGIERVVSGIR